MIRVRQIKVPIVDDKKTIIEDKFIKKLKINKNDLIDYKIHKKSIDARKKENILFVYELDVNIKNERKIIKKIKSNDILIVGNEEYISPSVGTEKLNNRIIIVGAGPAGLFATYLLAENGYKPILIERGEPIEKRVNTVSKFWNTNILNENSNVQFGEGGAGTFSDGKLNTLVSDENYRRKKVFEVFVSCGAPKDILYLQKPHIGTDILRNVIVNMRNKILEMGGEIYYNSCLTDLIIEDNSLRKIEINHSKFIDCENLVLAIGHSARDTFKLLNDKKIDMQAKPYAVGVRVMHPQNIINTSQYGKYADILPPASYKLTYTTKKGRGVYSFCMCPGGYIVNASSEKNAIAINGMSNYKRESDFANSAIVVTVGPKDYGNHVLDGVHFQRTLEQNAYKCGKGLIPVSKYKDYVQCKNSLLINNLAIKGKYTFANINDIFPEFINESIKEAMPIFGKKIKHFDDDEMIIAAIESRTSSPVKIIRDENYEANIKGIYPCGEGAGYAGGITTAAIDGLKVSESIIKKYSNIID